MRPNRTEDSRQYAPSEYLTILSDRYLFVQEYTEYRLGF